MTLGEKVASRSRATGIVCATGAVALGLFYMQFAGAPASYLLVHVCALVIGLAIMALLDRMASHEPRWSGVLTIATALALLATASFGVAVKGAARWVSLGSMAVQPALILLPVAIMSFAASRSTLSTIAMIIAAAALAIQPDRAMAAMLAAGLTVAACVRPDRFVIPACLASLIGFAATMVQADNLPAMPYVDQIFYSSFDVHLLAGLAVITGSLLLLVPAIIGGFFNAEHRERYLVFAAIWTVAIIAAALANYPTPVVGYSGGAVLGYVLSLSALTKRTQRRTGASNSSGLNDNAIGSSDRHLLVAHA